MKKFFLLALLAVASVHAQPKIDFHEGKLADAFKQAKSEKKSVFFMGYATWCPHCNKMKSEVFRDTAVINFYNRNFVCVWQDMEKPEAAKIKSAYRIRSYPALLYFNANGDLAYSVFAQLTAKNFIDEGKKALTEKEQLPYQKAQFEADPSNTEKALAYISGLRRSHLDTEPVAQQYFSHYKVEDLMTEPNWRIIAYGERDITSKQFRYVLGNREGFEHVASPKRVEKKILNIVDEWLDDAIEAGDTTAYLQKRLPVEEMHLHKTDSLLYRADLALFSKTGNWDRYVSAAAFGVGRFSWQDARGLRDIARNHMLHITKPAMLDNAILWAKRSQELSPNYETLIIIARLCLKAGDKAQAKEWADKAMALAKSSGFDTKQADAVLEELKS
jgi:thioredoxin-related protein